MQFSVVFIHHHRGDELEHLLLIMHFLSSLCLLYDESKNKLSAVNVIM